MTNQKSIEEKQSIYRQVHSKAYCRRTWNCYCLPFGIKPNTVFQFFCPLSPFHFFLSLIFLLKDLRKFSFSHNKKTIFYASKKIVTTNLEKNNADRKSTRKIKNNFLIKFTSFFSCKDLYLLLSPGAI